MPATGRSLLFLFLIASGVHADDDAPAIFQGEHFYNAIGTANTEITATAMPRDVQLGDAITYTLTVRHVRNPSKVQRPDFYKLREFGLSFAYYPHDVSTVVDGDTVTFTWKMRPRTTEETAIPGLQFDYYLPEAAEGNQLRKKFVEPIEITVRPKDKSVAPNPTGSEWYHVRVDDTTPNDDPPGFMHWLAIPLILIPLTILYVTFWHRRNPQGARLAAINRNRVVKRTLAKLQSPCDADGVAVTIRDYLRERPDHPAIQAVMRDCDAARFGNSSASNLSEDAIAAIRDNEEAILTSQARSQGGGAPSLTTWPARDWLGVGAMFVISFAAYLWCVIWSAPPDSEWHHYNTPGVYINAARASLEEGNRPLAIFRFRYGLSEYPTHTQLRHDLVRVSDRGAASVDVWHSGAIYNLLYILAWISGLIAATGIALRLTTRPAYAGIVMIAGLLGLVACTVIHGIGKRKLESGRTIPFGVLTEPTRLRTGNGESYDPVLAEPLSPGAEVLFLNRRGGWLQVQLANGETGWVLESQALVNDASLRHR